MKIKTTIKIACKHENDAISREPLVDIDPTECFLYEAVLIFCNLAFQDGCHLLLLRIALKLKMTIFLLQLNGF